MRNLSIFRALLVLSACCAPVLAQQTGLTGRVTDPSAASIANARISANSQDGSKLQTATNSEGIYQFPGLRAGTFVIRFEASGFTPAERTIELLVGQVATIDIAL